MFFKLLKGKNIFLGMIFFLSFYSKAEGDKSKDLFDIKSKQERIKQKDKKTEGVNFGEAQDKKTNAAAAKRGDKDNVSKKKGEGEKTYPGFYEEQYAAFKELYNGAYLTPEERLLMGTKVDETVYSLDNVRVTDLQTIKSKDFCWRKYKRPFYFFDNIFLSSVWNLYSPPDVLSCSDFKNFVRPYEKGIGITTGYKRFDKLKRDISFLPIFDTKVPITTFTVYMGDKKGLFGQFEYNASINKNFHIGLKLNAIPLQKFYNSIVLYEKKENGENKETPYYISTSFFFNIPFYFYGLYRKDKWTCFFNIKTNSFSVSESGGCTIKRTDTFANTSNFKYNSCNCSEYDFIKTRQDDFSFLLYLKYLLPKDIAEFYIQTDFEKETNSFEITKPKELCPLSKREGKNGENPPQEQEDGNNVNLNQQQQNEDEKYKYINSKTIDFLGLRDEITQNALEYFSSFFFRNINVEVGFTNLNFKILGINFFLKLFGKGNIGNFLREKKIIEEHVILPRKQPEEREPFKIFGLGGEFAIENLKLRAEGFFAKERNRRISLSYERDFFLFRFSYSYDFPSVFLCKQDERIEEGSLKNINVFLSLPLVRVCEYFSFSFFLNPTVFYKRFYNVIDIDNQDVVGNKKIKYKTKQNVNDLLDIKTGLNVNIKTFQFFFIDFSIVFHKKQICNASFGSIKQGNFFVKDNGAENERVDNVPLFSFIGKLYYERRMNDDKNSFVSCGVNFEYKTFFHPDEFYIVTQQWYNQPVTNQDTDFKIMLPLVNLFLKVRVSYFDISWEINNILELITGLTAIVSPYYLNRPSSFFNFLISFVTMD